MNNSAGIKRSLAIGIPCFGVLLFFALILIFPVSRGIFEDLSGKYPFLMGFVKFGLLATIGELFAIRIVKKQWALPVKLIGRMLIWGLIGVWITFMMKAYSFGIQQMMETGLLPGGDNFFLKAFYTSATMNLTFGPTFMAIHKCTDKWLELRAEKRQERGVSAIIREIDWSRFVMFTLFKTIPLFWIPAHTVTFLLPAEYQVIMAAALSIALGVILSLKK